MDGMGSSSGSSAARGRTQALPSITRLRAAFHGRVISPADADYDAARTVFYGGFDRKPAVIVRAADATDVAGAIALARETGLDLAVRSGGHSSAGHSVCDGGIVIDLSAMRELVLDVEGHTAWAQSGLTAGEFGLAADMHNLITGFGDTASVGIGGLTLGGGIGYLVRKFGLTIDDLLAAEIVTADGQILQVNDASHPDLFWAIRGGGGNFGVVTRFQFRLHDLGPVLGGMLMLPATPDVIRAFIAEADAAPDELSTIANILPAPAIPLVPEAYHGRPIVMGMMLYAGPAEDGERVIAPFRALVPPILDTVRPIRYSEIFEPEDPSHHPIATGHSLFIDAVDDDMAGAIIDYLETSAATMAVAQLRVLGGAMARVPVEATAFAHRQRRILANLAALYQHPEEAGVHREWAERFAATLGGAPGVYVNFLGLEGEGRVREAYPGPTWDRLQAIKTRYDPTNQFHFNQNIPPAASET
jgi:FAD/FMN-containing dehydrogenase